jgi:threonine aldolase
MSNLIAIGTHCRRGDEVICGDKAHIFLYEGGGANGEQAEQPLDHCYGTNRT